MNSILEAPETYLGPIGKALVGIVIMIIGIVIVKLICNLAEKLFNRKRSKRKQKTCSHILRSWA